MMEVSLLTRCYIVSLARVNFIDVTGVKQSLHVEPSLLLLCLLHNMFDSVAILKEKDTN